MLDLARPPEDRGRILSSVTVDLTLTILLCKMAIYSPWVLFVSQPHVTLTKLCCRFLKKHGVWHQYGTQRGTQLPWYLDYFLKLKICFGVNITDFDWAGLIGTCALLLARLQAFHLFTPFYYCPYSATVSGMFNHLCIFLYPMPNLWLSTTICLLNWHVFSHAGGWQRDFACHFYTLVKLLVMEWYNIVSKTNMNSIK